jgi:hypothetical protein
MSSFVYIFLRVWLPVQAGSKSILLLHYQLNEEVLPQNIE